MTAKRRAPKAKPKAKPKRRAEAVQPSHLVGIGGSAGSLEPLEHFFRAHRPDHVDELHRGHASRSPQQGDDGRHPCALHVDAGVRGHARARRSSAASSTWCRPTSTSTYGTAASSSAIAPPTHVSARPSTRSSAPSPRSPRAQRRRRALGHGVGRHRRPRRDQGASRHRARPGAGIRRVRCDARARRSRPALRISSARRRSSPRPSRRSSQSCEVGSRPSRGAGEDGQGLGRTDVLDASARAASHDFSQYKKSTMARRIERRMNLHRIPDDRRVPRAPRARSPRRSIASSAICSSA